MRSLALLAIMMLVMGCSSPPSQVMRAITDQLKDPSSVQWKDVKYENRKDSWGKTHLVACGAFNAKNSFGAYAGFKDFVYDDGNLVIEGSPSYLNYSVCPH